MKNKRTKLTALLLSALMAVSTISSVTWAADLFSDGSDVESVDSTETAIEISVDQTEEDVSEFGNEVLLTSPYDPSTAKGNDSDKIWYFDDGVVTVDGKKYVKIYTGTKPTSANQRTQDDLADVIGETLIPATCIHDSDPHGILYRYTFSYSSLNGIVYCKGWVSGVENQDSSTGAIIPPKDQAIIEYKTPLSKLDDYTCDKSYTYKEGVYYKCPVCGKYYTSLNEADFSDKTKITEDRNLAAENKSFEIEPQNHNFGAVKEDIIPPDNYPSDKASEDAIRDYFGVGDSMPLTDAQIKAYYSKKANCEIDSNGKHTGNLLPDQDAYYYTVRTCSICGKTEGVKHVIYNANMQEGERYYKFDENLSNISYFLYIDKDGVLTKWDSNVIPEDKYADVVLTDCNKTGEFYLCSVNKNNVLSTLETKHKYGHTLENVKLVGIWEDASKTKPLKIYLNDGTVASEAVLGRDIDTKRTGISLTIENGNITEVKAANCKANKYYYELERKCFNYKECNHKDSSIGGLKTMSGGDHVWESLGPDDFKIDYKYVDELHHWEYYYDNFKCKYCEARKQDRSVTKEDALVSHKFTSQEVEGTRVEPTCGKEGTYQRAEICACKYVKEGSTTTSTIKATDKHDFGDNKVYLVWSGDVYIAKNGEQSAHNIQVSVGRKCNVCGLFDGNGINTQGIDGIVDDKGLPIIKDAYIVTPTRKAKIDPATGIAYRCSTALATVEVNWVGTVDGELVRLNKDNYDEAVRENVPYYSDIAEYQARTAHTPGKPQKEGDWIIRYCSVCGDIVSKDPDTTPDVGVPSVSAAAVDYDTVNVSWTKVDGATAYRLYFRSSDEGISKWQRIRTFTSDATSYQVNGLTTGSKYRFTVRAEITSDGETTLGDYSKTGAVAVPKLTAPEIKSVTASGKTTKVTWSRVDGASGYIVFRNSQRVGTVTKGSKVTWTDKKPVSGAKYQIRAYRTEDKKNYKSDLSVAK